MACLQSKSTRAIHQSKAKQTSRHVTVLTVMWAYLTASCPLSLNDTLLWHSDLWCHLVDSITTTIVHIVGRALLFITDSLCYEVRIGCLSWIQSIIWCLCLCVCSCVKVKALYDKLILNTDISVITAEHMNVVCVCVCARVRSCVRAQASNCSSLLKLWLHDEGGNH